MKSPYKLTEKQFKFLQQEAAEKYNSLISSYMLRRAYDVTSNFSEKHDRMFTLRADFRFAQSHVPGEPDMPICFQKDDEKAITRAIESLKSQLREDHKRSGRAGEPTPLGYIWARERVTGERILTTIWFCYSTKTFMVIWEIIQSLMLIIWGPVFRKLGAVQ
jgi:hypothetical protein